MKLYKFHVLNRDTSPKRHCDTVTGRNRRIRRKLVDLTDSSGRQKNRLGAESLNLFRLRIQSVKPQHTILIGRRRATLSQFLARDEFHGKIMFKRVDIRRGGRRVEQGLFDRLTRDILNM